MVTFSQTPILFAGGKSARFSRLQPLTCCLSFHCVLVMRMPGKVRCQIIKQLWSAAKAQDPLSINHSAALSRLHLCHEVAEPHYRSYRFLRSPDTLN